MKIIQTISFTGTIGLTQLFRLPCVKGILKSGGDTPVLILKPGLMGDGEPAVVMPGNLCLGMRLTMVVRESRTL